MKMAEARQITGGLSKPSKMPGAAYSLPAQRCMVGSKLVKKKGSVCHGCYALKGFYRMPVVKAALERRFHSLDDPLWVDAMVTLVSQHRWFRWHDSGDLQSVKHLERICDVALRTPDVRHWLPTREVRICRSFSKNSRVVPDNLIIRISSPMVDGPPLPYPHTSTVVTEGYTCPAGDQGNECKECRKCWDKEVPNVSYHKH